MHIHTWSPINNFEMLRTGKEQHQSITFFILLFLKQLTQIVSYLFVCLTQQLKPLLADLGNQRDKEDLPSWCCEGKKEKGKRRGERSGKERGKEREKERKGKRKEERKGKGRLKYPIEKEREIIVALMMVMVSLVIFFREIKLWRCSSRGSRNSVNKKKYCFKTIGLFEQKPQKFMLPTLQYVFRMCA